MCTINILNNLDYYIKILFDTDIKDALLVLRYSDFSMYEIFIFDIKNKLL